MRCEEVREQFADYVIDQVQEPARTAVREHLASCTNCRAEAEDLKTLWKTLGAIPAAEPTPELRTRFQIMLEAYEHGLGNATAGSWRRNLNSWLIGWWPRRPLLQLGVSLTLLILGLIVGRYFHFTSTGPTPQTNPEVAELRSEVLQMRQMVALSLMQQQSASDRLRGVNWSYQLQQPGREVLTALVDTLMHDPNVNVRLATVDALRQFGDQPVVRRGVIEALNRQQSAMVQIALIDLAVDLREKESIDTLRQFTQDGAINAAVRARAQKGLTELQ
jgi:hypothetical protein